VTDPDGDIQERVEEGIRGRATDMEWGTKGREE
jgi:hypothetical protein